MLERLNSETAVAVPSVPMTPLSSCRRYREVGLDRSVILEWLRQIVCLQRVCVGTLLSSRRSSVHLARHGWRFQLGVARSGGFLSERLQCELLEMTALTTEMTTTIPLTHADCRVYWHCSHNMRQVLCNGTASVCLFVSPSVRPSACPIYRPLHSARWVCCCAPGGQEISIDSAGRRSTAHSSTGFSSKCEQCHIVSWRRKLTTDLLFTAVLSLTSFTGSLIDVRACTRQQVICKCRCENCLRRNGEQSF